MDVPTRYRWTTAAVAVVAASHAVATWPLADAVGLFLGGLAVATAAELVAVRAGLLEHHVGPAVAGVPLHVLPGWPAAIYVALRLALFVVPPGPRAAALAAAIAAGTNLVADPRGVADGAWSYPDHPLSRLRVRDVPWWSFAGWLAVGFATAMVPVAVG